MPDLSVLETLVRIAWLAGAVAFVLGLSRMNSPATARNGNLLSAAGMAVAIIGTIVYLLIRPSDTAFNLVGWVIIAAGIALGGGL
ncbi:MAG TPA: NAD(P)(+) transhydrogenase (Re/Si-specific) subunit beta, partial [Candidatus Limnocylindrales bacterium]